jgi:hypothetical protein
MISLCAAARAEDLEGHDLANEFGRTLAKDGQSWRAFHAWATPEDLARWTPEETGIASLVTSDDTGADALAHFETFLASQGLTDE